MPTNYREVLKVTAVGEMAVRLFLAPDQETGVGSVDRDQLAMVIAGSVVPFAGTTREFVVLVADDGGRIAEAAGDRPDDPALPVPKELLI